MFGALFLLALCAGTHGRTPVAAYLPEWRYFHDIDYDAMMEHVTHLIFFSLEINADGSLNALDRIPLPGVLVKARRAADANGAKLMICFGGNGRTGGYPQMVASKDARRAFLKNLRKLCKKYKFDGVDYNWEYPRNKADWTGLVTLMRETKRMFARTNMDGIVSMAYYPDGQQERILGSLNAGEHADFLHAMSYDQPGRHSTMKWSKEVMQRSLEHLPANKVTMGLPFYGRDYNTGDWKTYEELLKSATPAPDVDEIGTQFFNGVDTIIAKSRWAVEQGLGGLMIWEVGQDVHPSHEASLLAAISAGLETTPEHEHGEL